MMVFLIRGLSLFLKNETRSENYGLYVVNYLPKYLVNNV